MDSCHSLSCLQGKTALFCGDSITAASVYDTEHPRWGWAGRIAARHGLAAYKNAGIDGASLSLCRGANRVVSQLQKNAGGSFDFVILHGGVNDAWDSAPVGRPTADDCRSAEQFDLSCFAGGMEELFCVARAQFPNAILGYILNYRFHPEVGIGRLGRMDDYVETAKILCAKWNIPCLDLYSCAPLQEALKPGLSPDCFGDGGVHPNSRGYELLTPYVAAFMADLCEAGAARQREKS